MKATPLVLRVALTLVATAASGGIDYAVAGPLAVPVAVLMTPILMLPVLLGGRLPV